jgi:hypothetical protein
MKKRTQFKVVVDRIEGNLAVVALYDDDSVKFNLPVKFLPEGTRGGDHFQVAFTEDKEGREETKKNVEGLLKELTGGKRGEKGGG